MLTGVIGILLAASGGVSAPHSLQPDDVCLLRDHCDREALVCLVDETRCGSWRDGRVCFVTHCSEQPLDLVPRGRGSSR